LVAYLKLKEDAESEANVGNGFMVLAKSLYPSTTEALEET
jgi:hypothetical protein